MDANTSSVFTPSRGALAAEHLGAAPVLPDNVAWSSDGKIVCVAHDSLLIVTFVNKDLTRYLLEPPFVSRTHIAVSKRPSTMAYPLPPPKMNEGANEAEDAGVVTYRIMNSLEPITSANPRELSLAKPDCDCYLQAVWGPRGTAPNASCALVALTTTNRILLHVPTTLNFTWACTAVLSDTLAHYIDKVIDQYDPLPADPYVMLPLPRAPKRHKKQLSYADKCDFMATTTIAWSSSSLLAFCGRRLITIWKFDANCPGYLTSEPLAALDTGVHGWPTTSVWSTDSSSLFVGTSSGNVVHIHRDNTEFVVKHVWSMPGCQAVSSVTVASSNVVVAAGGSVSVFSTSQGAETCHWTAHTGTITKVVAKSTEDAMFTCSLDGSIKSWDLQGNQTHIKHLPTKGYPIFGLSLSPNDFQLTCSHVIPPAARPCRTTQADTTYTRVSGGLEHFAAASLRDGSWLTQAVFKVLDERPQSIDSLTDLLALCYHDDQARTSKDVDYPSFNADGSDVEPIYKPLVEELCTRYAALPSSTSWPEPTYLQVAYQIWSCMQPRACPPWIVKAILCYWAEANVLTASQGSLPQASQTSVLLMADYLWAVSVEALPAPVSFELKPATKAAMEAVYSKYGNSEDTSRIQSHQGTLPAREHCNLCNASVALSSNLFAPVCSNGHALERSFATFKLVANDVWKCITCEAFAEVDTCSSTTQHVLHCHLCGCFCQQLTY